ncbi:MAG: hypothetical protein Q4C91_05105 [Eubacteriales bacterium]|nr:hypothetical protein [Eubacteriales bacterium]
MWTEILDKNALKEFMESVSFFHDSCIKEMKYLSGAYVDEDLSMYPVNDRRVLSVIIQRQFKENSMIEMEFQGLKYLKLFPADDKYTCEILDSTMILKDDCIYWCDQGGLSEADLDAYEGTLLCASKFRWRPVEGCMGQKEFFLPIR